MASFKPAYLLTVTSDDADLRLFKLKIGIPRGTFAAPILFLFLRLFVFEGA